MSMTDGGTGRRAALIRMAWGMAALAAPSGVAIVAGTGASPRAGGGGTARIRGTSIRMRIVPLDVRAIGRGDGLAG